MPTFDPTYENWWTSQGLRLLIYPVLFAVHPDSWVHSSLLVSATNSQVQTFSQTSEWCWSRKKSTSPLPLDVACYLTCWFSFFCLPSLLVPQEGGLQRHFDEQIVNYGQQTVINLVGVVKNHFHIITSAEYVACQRCRLKLDVTWLWLLTRCFYISLLDWSERVRKGFGWCLQILP